MVRFKGYLMSFKNCLLITASVFLLIGLNTPSHARKKPLLTNSSLPKSPALKKAKTDLQTIGLILGFHKWPNKKEEATILNQMKTAGLKKTTEFKEFKVWVFKWKKWHKGEAAEKLCKSLSGLSSLDYCEPDYTLIPAQSSDDSDDSEDSWREKVIKVLQNLLALFVEGPDSETEDPESELMVQPGTTNPGSLVYPNIPANQRNITSCRIVSSGLLAANLSDYWSQEMIGGDLLKESLKDAPPVNKELVGVFDTAGPDEDYHHDVGVKNLISGEGKQAILPDLGQGLKMYDTPKTSDTLQHSSDLLSKVAEQCQSQSGTTGSRYDDDDNDGGNDDGDQNNPSDDNKNKGINTDDIIIDSNDDPDAAYDGDGTGSVSGQENEDDGTGAGIGSPD